MADVDRSPEDDLIAVSALQHLLFCERQFALIHIEGLWAENRLTVEGRHLHERVDSGAVDTRSGVRVVRNVAIQSFRMGLKGRADSIEIAEDGTITPVEYKRGRPKPTAFDRVQLCAQALCLEEMFGRPVTRGYLFYARPRRRSEVAFYQPLRRTTERAIDRARRLIRTGLTPAARRETKCAACSLIELCMPDAMEKGSARGFAETAVAAALTEEPS